MRLHRANIVFLLCVLSLLNTIFYDIGIPYACGMENSDTSCCPAKSSLSQPAISSDDCPRLARQTSSEIVINNSGSLVAQQGGISCISPMAAIAGLKMLQKGGNVVDALVASALASTVVAHGAHGLGGYGGNIIIFLKELGEPVIVDFTTRAPLAATYDMFYKDGYDQTTILAVTPWNTVAGLYTALEKFGTMPWQEVIQPAIHYAQEGFVLSHQYASLIQSCYKNKMSRWPAAKKIFTRPSGDVLQAGDLFIQKELAASLRLLAQDGPDVIYTGSLARNMVNFIQANGGIISMDDLADWRKRLVRIQKAVCASYRGYEVYSSPYCSAGENLLEILNILEGFNLPELGYSPDSVHLMLESFKLSYADRYQYVADPWMEHVPYAGLISPAYADARRELIDANQAGQNFTAGDPWPYEPGSKQTATLLSEPQERLPQDGDTASASFVDKDGNLASLTMSLRNAFGCGATIPDTGIVLNDGMTVFKSEPQHAALPNRIDPNKLAVNNMCPFIVLNEGKAYFTGGAAGGTKIATTCAVIIVAVIDWQMNLKAAINMPRFHNEGGATSYFEMATPREVIEPLIAKCHNCDSLKKFCVSHGILIDPISGQFYIASDSSRQPDSTAAGLVIRK